MNPRRFEWLGASAVVVLLGLWLRFSAPVPEWLRDASGGALYVVFWMLAFLVLRPQTSALPLAITVFLATCAIEFSQAWHAVWLDRLRGTLPGRLVLGTTFDWGDFPPYALGAAIGWAVVSAREKLGR